jgi:DNA polymerase-3 subunit epsilon
MSQPSLFDRSEDAHGGSRGGEPGPPRHLRLERPLVVFDLETTGVDPSADRIVQIALIRSEPDGTRRVFETLVDPERPIPPDATRIHGITDADVAGKPAFGAIRADVEALLTGADLAGFNSIAFDQPMLQAELHRAGSQLDLDAAFHVDAMVIFKLKEPRDLSAAYRFYCGGELTDAHSALADAEATLAILDAQIARYEDLPSGVRDLHVVSRGRYVDATRKFVWDAEGEAVLNFGQLRGTRLRDVVAEARGRGFLEWMLAKDFTAEVKRIAAAALAGEFPRRLQTGAGRAAGETGANDGA